MRLLVSVANATDASAALAGGADVIDAKDPSAGALGAVSAEVLHQIVAAVDGSLVSAALGDATDEDEIQGLAHAFALAGARFVKVGFAGIVSAERAAALIAATVRGATYSSAGDCGVVAVAYADAELSASIAPAALIDVASRAGARGVLIDTTNKDGPGLRALADPHALGEWVARAHAAKLLVALAGRLTAEDLSFVRAAGADIAGVRGAACQGGRNGWVSADKVRLLRALCAAAHPPEGGRHEERHPVASSVSGTVGASRAVAPIDPLERSPM